MLSSAEICLSALRTKMRLCPFTYKQLSSLTVLDKFWFFLRTLWSSWRALTHLTRSFSLSVNMSCVSDSPGGVIWDAVTCKEWNKTHTIISTQKRRDARSEDCVTWFFYSGKTPSYKRHSNLRSYNIELTLKMHFNSFLLACITSAASTLLTENSSSLRR